MKLLGAWLACALPRMTVFLFIPPSPEYRYFIDGSTGSFWYPLYFDLARLMWSLSGGLLPVYILLHLAIDACLGPVIYLLATRLEFTATSRWLSVFGVAAFPYYASLTARQPNVGMTVAGFALLLLGFAAWADAGFGLRGGIRFAIIAFVLHLLRPNILATVVALYAFGFVLLMHPKVRSGRVAPAGPAGLIVSGLLLAGLMSGLAGWNRHRTGHFTPFTPNSGYDLYVGNNPWLAEYMGRHDIPSFEQVIYDKGLPPAALAENDPYARDSALGGLALRYALSHPRQTLRNSLMKALRYWDFRLDDADVSPALWNAAYLVPYLGCVLLAGWGAWRLWARGVRFPLALILVALVSYWLPHVVYFPSIRMRMTAEFLLILLAASALAPPAPRRSTACVIQSGPTSSIPT